MTLRGTPSARPSLARRLVNWLAGFEDGQILRAAFFGMLAATACVVVIDYMELSARDELAAQNLPGVPVQPILPAFDPSAPQGKPGPEVTTDRKLLEQPLAIALGGGGVLTLTGTIDSGAADRFAAEIKARGEYVKTIALDSPGGSVGDALAIGKLIHDHAFTTSVAAGALCASSCPLMFAGGKKRLASAKAAIGVHVIYEATSQPLPSVLDARAAVGTAMSAAQRTTGEIERYLTDMGVDPGLWLHALDTPPDRLYYFSAAELIALKLVTNVTD